MTPERAVVKLLPEACTACGACASVCPTRALTLWDAAGTRHVRLDSGACIACGACEPLCAPHAVVATRIASALDRRALATEASLPVPTDTPALPPAEPPALPVLVERVNRAIGRRYRRSLAIRPVSAGDCGGCMAELGAAFGPLHDCERLGVELVVSPRHADALWVTGPVTRNLKDALLRAYQAMPEPRLVIASGTCAIDGNVFAGSPEVLGGVDRVLPVDIYVPGCPPTPRAIIEALLAVMGRG